MRLQLLSRLAPLALAVAVGACGSSDTAPGRINVRLVDAPGDYKAITLNVQRVEIHTGEGWRTLGTPDVTVNLLELVNGVAATLVEDAVIDAGRYTQLRLVLGQGNTVTLEDDSVHELKVPSGMQSGVKLTTSFDVAPNTTADLFIDFDAHRSIFVHKAGNSAKYILRPTVRAVDRVVTGAIVGTLRDGAGPLPGVEVTAQTTAAGGTPEIVRSTVTGIDGSYVLDLLPVGGSYHVVSQPVVRLGGAPVAAYDAQASAAIAVTASAPTPSYDATFTAVAIAPGTLSGTVLPVAIDSPTRVDADFVTLVQSLDAGGTPLPFIVRTVIPEVNGVIEAYAVDALPAGDYSATLTRVTTDGEGNDVERVSAAANVSIGSGTNTPQDFTLP